MYLSYSEKCISITSKNGISAANEKVSQSPNEESYAFFFELSQPYPYLSIFFFELCLDLIPQVDALTAYQLIGSVLALNLMLVTTFNYLLFIASNLIQSLHISYHSSYIMCITYSHVLVMCIHAYIQVHSTIHIASHHNKNQSVTRGQVCFLCQASCGVSQKTGAAVELL